MGTGGREEVTGGMGCLEIFFKSQKSPDHVGPHTSGSEFASILATPEGVRVGDAKSCCELQRVHTICHVQIAWEAGKAAVSTTCWETGRLRWRAAVGTMGTRMDPAPWDERGWEEGGREANTSSWLGVPTTDGVPGGILWDPGRTVMVTGSVPQLLDGSRLHTWKTHLP